MPGRWRQAGAVCRFAACLWPGLPQLGRHGSWWGLAAAVAFAWLICLLLVTTWVWTEWVAPAWRNSAAGIAAVMWIVGIAVSCREMRRNGAPATDQIADHPDEDLFSAAVTEYLRNNLLAAERQLQAISRQNGDDVPAQLLLATVWRRMGRAAEARGLLTRLTTLERGEPWRMEIEREIARLSDAAKPQPVESTVPPSSSDPRQTPAAHDAALAEHLDPAA